MSAVLQNLVNQPYKHGFVTDIGLDVGDERAERRHRPVDLNVSGKPSASYSTRLRACTMTSRSTARRGKWASGRQWMGRV